MDPAKGARTSRSRRKIFSCPVCDEVFIDEESLKRHELTHQNPESGEGEAPVAEVETPPAAAEDDSPSAVQEQPEATAPRARPLSSVRRQAAAAQAQAQAQVEPQANFLPPDSALDMPVDPDATVQVLNPQLGPLAWEAEAKKGGGFGLGPLWGFVEDFSEWFVRGTTQTAGVVGFSLLSGVSLALRGLLLLAMAGACVYAGIWFGHVYGPRLWNQPVESPVVPPVRIIDNSPEVAQQSVRELVTGFYASINDKDYQEAYAALSSAWQKEMTYDQFCKGYKNTQTAHCSVKDVRSMEGGRYQMEISLEVMEKGRKSQYKGVYVAISTPQGWKLDQGTIR